MNAPHPKEHDHSWLNPPHQDRPDWRTQVSLARRMGHQAPPLPLQPLCSNIWPTPARLWEALQQRSELFQNSRRVISSFTHFNQFQVMMIMINDGLSSKLLFCQVAVSMKTQSTSLSLGGSRPLLRILGRTRGLQCQKWRLGEMKIHAQSG